MSLNSTQRLNFLLMLLVLIVPTAATNIWKAWQGTGNMTESNMTEIKNLIKNNAVVSADSIDPFNTALQAISTRLNTIWEPAWNVVLVLNTIGNDAVLYGYAFKNHWLWINGVAIPGEDVSVLSYVIWKDYNCHGWRTILPTEELNSTFTGTQQTAILSATFPKVYTDVWGAAFAFVEFLNVQPSLSSGAYSVVMNQDTGTYFIARICVVNKNVFISSDIFTDGTGTARGSYMMFQTR